MPEVEKLDLSSLDLAAEKRQELRAIFPEVWTEDGKIDLERLQLALGESLDIGKERYGLTWPGKAECFRTIQAASLATLLPCRDESINFDTSENLIIEGDNLEVLKLLQKSYLGSIKMIYIDPPYNTGNDFIYPDDYSESLQTYLAYTGQVDTDGRKFGTNTEAGGRFHTKWLNMLYPRLYLARNLLRDDGLIFLSSDDHEIDNMRMVCREILGEENFVAQFVWNTEGHTDNQFDVKINHEYVLLYAKNSDKAALGHVVDPNTRQESNLWKGFAENSITKNGPGNPASEVWLPEGFPCSSESITLPRTEVPAEFFVALAAQGYISRAITERFSLSYPVRLNEMRVQSGRLTQPCRVFSGWANVNKLKSFIANDCRPIDENGDQLSFYLSERGVVYYRRDRESARNILSVLRNMGTTEKMRSELEALGIPFQYPKPKELLTYLIQIGLGPEEVVLDFFAGSGTIGHAALELNRRDGGNRRFILVQLPEPTNRDDFATIAQICRERVRRIINNLNREHGGKRNRDDERMQGCGFRAFSLAESNFTSWDADAPNDAESMARQLELHVDHVRDGRSAEDLLYEILLKSGFPLTSPVEAVTLAGKTAYRVADGALFLCLEPDLTLDAIRAMAEQKPERVVCLDEAFAGNDQLKANAAQIFKSAGTTFRPV